MRGLEVNTDHELVNPNWELFADEHDRRYGLAISYVKSLVKGVSYDNQVMNLRVGRRGFYAQSKRFPAAFYGNTGLSDITFIGRDEAQAIAWEAVALYRAGEARSLTCVYSDDDPAAIFFGYRFESHERYEMGTLRSSLPLHLRVMISSPEVLESLGARQGVLIYHRTASNKHLLVKARGPYQPYPGMGELGD